MSKRFRALWFAVAIVCGSGWGIVGCQAFRAPESVGDAQSGARLVQSGATATATATSAPTATSTVWPPPVIMGVAHGPEDGYEGLGMLADMSEVIAEVDVEDVLGVRYNTPDGGVPTPYVGSSDIGLRVFRPVILRVIEYHRNFGVNADGYVVAEWGGETDELIYEAVPHSPFSGDEMSPAVGPGLAFLTTYPTETFTVSSPLGSPSYIGALQDVAADHSAATGKTYLPAYWNEFFEYIDDSVADPKSGTIRGMMNRENLDEFVSEVVTTTNASATPDWAYP